MLQGIPREEKEGKKIKIGVIKKSEISFIHPDERRMMSSEYSTEEEHERLRKVLEIETFAVVAFVQRGVAEWRRVSRYRGEARDV